MVLTESEYKLKKGDASPEFSLPGTDGKTYPLENFKGKTTLIIFMCNHCPYVIEKLPQLNRIAQDFKDKLNVIGINSNESENYQEDSFENMQKAFQQGKIKFLYLHDESQSVAKSYGAVCTPDPFLFDSELKLIYHGNVDELHEAIEEYLEKGSVSKKEIPSMGCSIKWK